ncbi:MAG TPA: hypothetical protein VGF81_02815 [Solirubrobacteraceae bacterium]
MSGEHAARNAMHELDEIERFHDRCSELMRERRRIASVLGGACRLRVTEFEGRRPYRFHDPRHAASRRWEMWMDAEQTRAVRRARRREAVEITTR